MFYNEDNTYQTVVVVHKLRASDLCQILAMKNRVRKDCNWSIVEHWIDIGLGWYMYLFIHFEKKSRVFFQTYRR